MHQAKSLLQQNEYHRTVSVSGRTAPCVALLWASHRHIPFVLEQLGLFRAADAVHTHTKMSFEGIRLFTIWTHLDLDLKSWVRSSDLPRCDLRHIVRHNL